MLKIIKGPDIEKELSKMAKAAAASLAKEEEAVSAIIKDVSSSGDAALARYTKKFDKATVSSKDLKVKQAEVQAAYKKVNPKFLRALKLAIKNIKAYHARQKEAEWFLTMPDDVVLGMRSLAIERVGLYVPGGVAAYPSSVLMNAIPAKLAGVPEIIMVTPPSKDGSINPYILVAASETGVSSIYKVGGAQAIAALAYGTETIRKVDKIVGPGNTYVTLAKKAVFGTVGIDKLAGPSEVVILADENSEPAFIAADMLAQAEHDPNASSILVTTSSKVAASVIKEISKQAKKLDRKAIALKSINENGKIFVVDELSQATDLVNRIAPEHLEILAASPQKILEDIKNAGAVFLGPYSPAVVGDYLAGPNHVLPTGGSARFSSPLGVYDFMKKQSVIGYTKAGLKAVKDDLKILAEVEGLDAHARAVDVRFSQ